MAELTEWVWLVVRIGGPVALFGVLWRMVAVFGSNVYSERAMRLLRRKPFRQTPAGSTPPQVTGPACHSRHQHDGMAPANTEGRHPSVADIAQWFTSDHLPADLQQVSDVCSKLAGEMLDQLPDSPELTAGLRKLLEARDCFVRAAIAARRR